MKTKYLNLYVFLNLVVLSLISMNSCTTSEDDCIEIICLNNGICNEGICECPSGFIGASCEIFDSTHVQILLDDGKTPKELIDEGISIKQLYGKIYEGGLIFMIYPDGSGLITTISDAPNLIWEDAITYCDNLIEEEKDDWFLPELDQLNLMWLNLADSDGNGNNTGPNDLGNLGGFLGSWYWGNFEATNGSGNVLAQYFCDGVQIGAPPNNTFPFRAIRSFN